MALQKLIVWDKVWNIENIDHLQMLFEFPNEFTKTELLKVNPKDNTTESLNSNVNFY